MEPRCAGPAGTPGGPNAAGPAQRGSMGGATPSNRSQSEQRPATSDQRSAPPNVTPVPAVPAPQPVTMQQPAAPSQTAGAQPGGGPGGPGGFDMTRFLPEGVTVEQLNAIRAKRRNQEQLTPAESTISAQVRENMQRAGITMGGPGGPGGGGQGGGQSGSGQGGNPQFGAGANQQPGQQPAATSQQPAGGQGGGGAGGFQMPSGFTQEQMTPIFTKMRNQTPLTASEQALMARFRTAMQSQAGRRRSFGSGNDFQFGGNYIVFVLREGVPTPVRVRTGVTDLDYSEVVSGLTEQDTVLMLPSASLISSQQEMRDRFQRMAGGGVPGMRQQTAAPTTQAAPAAPPGARPR